MNKYCKDKLTTVNLLFLTPVLYYKAQSIVIDSNHKSSYSTFLESMNRIKKYVLTLIYDKL